MISTDDIGNTYLVSHEYQHGLRSVTWAQDGRGAGIIVTLDIDRTFIISRGSLGSAEEGVILIIACLFAQHGLYWKNLAY
jgi:hypothetical protein